MRYTNISEVARKYHYWRGFLTASLLCGIPFAVVLVACSNLINVIVK